MSGVSDFEKYRLRQQRLLKLEQLYKQVKWFFITRSCPDELVRDQATEDLKRVLEEIDKLPPPVL